MCLPGASVTRAQKSPKDDQKVVQRCPWGTKDGHLKTFPAPQGPFGVLWAASGAPLVRFPLPNLLLNLAPPAGFISNIWIASYRLMEGNMSVVEFTEMSFLARPPAPLPVELLLT